MRQLKIPRDAARIAYLAERAEYRRELAGTSCPCNNDLWGHGPCEDCRARIEQNRQRILAAVEK